MGRGESIILIFISQVRAHLKNLGPKDGSLFKKVWVNDADVAICTTVQLSGQSNNVKRNLKESIREVCVKSE